MALEPTRSRLLSELASPASAATLAVRVGLGRQKVNYHLNALEAHGLVQLAQERQWGGLTERLLVATATSYVISPGALGPVAADLGREVDRLSASYLIALGGIFGHPDDTAIARTILYGGSNHSLWFNYGNERNRRWSGNPLQTRYGYETRYPAEREAGVSLALKAST